MDKKQIRILLIEDNPTDVIFLREALEQDTLDAFILTVVERLDSALETLQKNTFDIVLLDLGLPDSHGLETFTQMHQSIPEIPKVILSGFIDESFALQAVHAGAQDYIVKGAFGFSSAARAIRYAIERQQAQEAFHASEARYHQVLDTMMEGCQVISFDWNYLYINDAAEMHNRRPKDELLGRKFMDMWLGIEATELFSEIQHCMEKRVVIQMETEFIFPDGTRGYFSFSIQPVPEGVFILSTDITESKHARDALRASEERFRALIENGSDDISLLGADGKLIWESPAVVRNLGYPMNSFLGHDIFELIHPDDKVWTSALYAKLLQKPGSRQEGIFRLQHSDGTWRWVEAVITNMLDNPSVQAVVANYHDITERKQAEIEIQQKNNDLGLINTINEAVIRGESLNAIVNLLAKELKRIFDSEGSAVYMLSADGQSLTMQQYLLSPKINRGIEKLIGNTIPLIHIPIRAGGFFHKVLQAGHGIITSDQEEIQNWMGEFVETAFLPSTAQGALRKLIPQIYKLLSFKSIIVVPLISNEKIIGLLDISSANLFADSDLKRIENVSRQLTAAILRQQADEKTQRSEEFLQSVQNALSANIAILDESGTIVQVNSAWRKFGEQNGLDHPQYAVGLNYLKICDSAAGPYAEEAPLVARAIRDVIAGHRREASIEYTCHSPEEKRWFLLRITKFEDGDQIWVVLAHENITERKQAEDSVRETSEQFRTLFEASPEAITLVDPQNGWLILDCNATSCAMNGYSRDELVMQSVNILNVTSGTPTERADYLERIRKEGILHYETLHRRKDGTVFPIEVSTSLITLGGREVVLGIDRDITERRRAEETLRESEALYRRAIEIAGAVPYHESYYNNGNSIKYEFIGEGIRQITGYGPDEFNAKLWESLVEEVNLVEDLEGYSLDEGIQRVRSGENTTWKCEHRIRDREGKIHWVFEAAVELRDEDGVPHGSIGTYQDITVRKQAEDALRESEQRYRALFEDMPIAIWEEDFSEAKKYLDFLRDKGITDFRKYFASHHESLIECSNKIKILNVNNAALRMYKAGSKEELFRSIYQEMSQGEKEHNIEDFVAIMEGRTRNSWDGIDETLTGEPINITLAWSVVPGYENDFSRVIVTTTDITEQKRDEQKLQESNERFRQLSDNIEEVFWITDVSSGKEIYISPAAEKIWRRSVEDLMQTPNAFIDCVLPEDQPSVALALTKQKKGQRTEIEYRITQPDGSTHWIWDRAFPVFDANGTLVRSAGIAADITERKQAEKDIARHLTELEALYENGLAVGRLLNQKEIGERIIATFAQHLSWHHVAIRLRHSESDELELIAFNLPGLSDKERTRIENHFNSMISKVGQGLSGWVAQVGKPFRTGNVHDQPKYITTHPNIQSGLYMPLKLGDVTIGVISVESEEPNAFTEQDERLLATLANQAANAFENARLYQTTQQELTERERIEIELRKSETHYRELADSITDIFFELDQDLHYSHWNKASEILTGVIANEAIGKSMREIFGESDEQIRIEKIYKDVLVNHRSRTFETLLIVNSQQRAFEVNAYPSTRGVSVVAKDVSDRKRSETLMQKRFELMEYSANHSLQELMQKTLDEISEWTQSKIGFFQFIKEDQITPSIQVWSTDTFKQFYYSKEDAIHKPADQTEGWAEALRQRRTIIHNNYENMSADHTTLVRELVLPIIRNEKIVAVIGVGNKLVDYTKDDLEITERFIDYAWDVTERKQMEVALADERNQLAIRVDERTADLSRANSNLARALRVKDEFLANMSHELRTPLNAILGLSESLAEQTAGPLNEKQQRYINTVSESGHHLLSLINDILDLAKIEAGQITLDVNKVDIHSVCDASLRMIKQLARKKNQEITLEVESSLGLMWADERRLKQMLVNLLSNAVKFTPNAGKLGLEVHGNRDQNKVTFTIWDTGIGIKESDLPLLFQPFVQLDSGLARESSGTGLGLALVAQMSRMHGGSTSVTSQPGQGSRFSIMLPWEPALEIDAIERLKSTGKFRPMQFNQGHKPTILLIEDTEDVIMMISDYLELNGYKTVTARDGIEGVTQAELMQPDLILMDIQMPRMDGFEATQKLRGELKFKHTPIIALTALAMPNDRERCLEAGMDEYITKPVHLRALVKMIENFLSGTKEIKSQ